MLAVAATRQVEAVMRAFGIESRSSSRISRAAKGADVLANKVIRKISDN